MKSEYFLALDVGTEAVKALIFKEENQEKTIFGASLVYFDRFGVWDGRDFEKDVMEKTLLAAIGEVQKEARTAQIKKCITLLGLPADILKGRVVSQSFKRENSQKTIEAKEEKEIYQAVSKTAKQKVAQKFFQDSGILPKELEFLSQKILERKIDGYEVSHLQNYNGERLEFRILLTFAPQYYLQSFKKIAQDLKLKVGAICHQAQNLIKIFEEQDALFLDIGGELTQIFLIRNGRLENIEEFEAGGKDFSQVLSQTLGVSSERARELKERYSKGLLSEEARERIQEIFSDSAREWLKFLKLKLSSFKNLLPPTFFIFGGSSLLPEIEEILSEEDWEKLSFSQPPKIKFFSPKNLKNITDTTYLLNNSKDVSPLLLTYGSEEKIF